MVVDIGLDLVYYVSMYIATKPLQAFIDLQKNKTKLARAIGISRQTLHSIKNGSGVSFKVAQKLVQITGFGFGEAFIRK